jgi:hypothetical protein
MQTRDREQLALSYLPEVFGQKLSGFATVLEFHQTLWNMTL